MYQHSTCTPCSLLWVYGICIYTANFTGSKGEKGWKATFTCLDCEIWWIQFTLWDGPLQWLQIHLFDFRCRLSNSDLLSYPLLTFHSQFLRNESLIKCNESTTFRKKFRLCNNVMCWKELQMHMSHALLIQLSCEWRELLSGDEIYEWWITPTTWMR